MATNRLVQKGKVEAYATVLFDAANAEGSIDKVVDVRNQLASIISIINSDMDLSYALSSTDYSPEQRLELARSVFASCDHDISEVVAVMAKNNDAELMFRVYHAYEQLMADKLKLCVMDVETVVELDDTLRKLIKDKAEAELGCKAVLNEKINRAILGGIIMSVNGRRIDASVISQLNRTRHLLKENDGGEN